jgi:hypothetical protein
LSRPELLRSSESRVGYRIANGEAARLAEMASLDHGWGRDFAAGVGEGDHDLADGAAGATFNPRDGQDDGVGPAADGQGAGFSDCTVPKPWKPPRRFHEELQELTTVL